MPSSLADRVSIDPLTPGLACSALAGPFSAVQALLMRLDHGLAYEDIALAFGWSIPTVKNEIHRARLKLRTHLLPHLTGERP